MHVGLVEHHILTVTPGVDLAIDEDPAIVGVRRRQSQVITQGAGERIAMRVQVAATRQQRKHRAFDVGNRTDQRHGFRAQGFSRRQRFVVPFEVETLPALLEERAETGVVVLFRRANIAFVEQVHGLVANGFPIVAQHVQFRKFAAIQVRLGRHTGEQVHQGVVRSKQRRVVDELAQNRQTRLAAQMHIEDAAHEQQQHQYLGG
ncbi:hypothetical protein D3C72_1095590 [compost metagenome]